jgi:hypothetical protein
MFFDGYIEPKKGLLSPDVSRVGLGLELKEPDISSYLINGV